jgi:hypothetical protein
MKYMLYQELSFVSCSFCSVSFEIIGCHGRSRYSAHSTSRLEKDRLWHCRYHPESPWSNSNSWFVLIDGGLDHLMRLSVGGATDALGWRWHGPKSSAFMQHVSC